VLQLWLARLSYPPVTEAANPVAATPGCLTFKMVTRACKGRRLTRNTQQKVVTAYNRAAGTSLSAADLFTYEA